jgi:hypothetical protein
MEEACLLLEKGDAGQALERAKDAGKKERTLCKEREQAGLAEQINLDLTYAVRARVCGWRACWRSPRPPQGGATSVASTVNRVGVSRIPPLARWQGAEPICCG